VNGYTYHGIMYKTGKRPLKHLCGLGISFYKLLESSKQKFPCSSEQHSEHCDLAHFLWTLVQSCFYPPMEIWNWSNYNKIEHLICMEMGFKKQDFKLWNQKK